MPSPALEHSFGTGRNRGHGSTLDVTLPATLQYPTSTSGYRLQLAYDCQNGLLKRVRDAAGGTVFWEAVSTNPWGRLQNESFGNVSWKSDVGSFSYHATKRRAVVSAGSHSYGYDANGNLTT